MFIASRRRLTLPPSTTGGNRAPTYDAPRTPLPRLGFGTPRVSPHFAVYIPSGAVKGALSGQGWDGVGVQPDVEVAATDALRTAYIAALESLMRRSSDEDERASLKAIVDQLVANAPSPPGP